MHLYPVDAAAHRIGKDETAWAARDATWSMVIAAIDSSPKKSSDLKRWGKTYWEEIHKFNGGGGYVNFMMDDEDEERVKASYGDNYPRLQTVRKMYDPSNLFRINQNIRPAA
jgi:hypothetical protein